MAWTTPKTNWTSESYITSSDYNRMLNNLNYLYDLAKKLDSIKGFTAMGSAKTYKDIPYADEFNAFENNLHLLNLSKQEIGTIKTFVDNGALPDYAELNRLENGMLKIKKSLEYSLPYLERLSVKLGQKLGFPRVKVILPPMESK